MKPPSRLNIMYALFFSPLWYTCKRIRSLPFLRFNVARVHEKVASSGFASFVLRSGPSDGLHSVPLTGPEPSPFFFRVPVEAKLALQIQKRVPSEGFRSGTLLSSPYSSLPMDLEDFTAGLCSWCNLFKLEHIIIYSFL